MNRKRKNKKALATILALILAISSSVTVFAEDTVTAEDATTSQSQVQVPIAQTPSDATPAANADFVIDSEGVLTKYKGSDENVVIPDGVKSIGDSAFAGCINLTGVTIPSSVTRIGRTAFGGCKNLVSVDIPNSVTSIGDGAFYCCFGLKGITIPNSVIYIGHDAFKGCTGITAVTIPSSVTTIGNDAFKGCTGLTSFIIDEKNTAYSIADGILYNKNKTTLMDCFIELKGEFIIPDSVTTIGQSAFNDCENLTSVTIPSSVTNIGAWAFSGCAGLKSVTIPNSVKAIGRSAFRACASLTAVTIPSSVTIIENDAFWDCTSLTTVTMPSSVTIIENGAFMGCASLKSVTIPNSVTTIGQEAFNGCASLTISGEKDSYAETYATKNSIPFKVIVPEIPDPVTPPTDVDNGATGNDTTKVDTIVIAGGGITGSDVTVTGIAKDSAKKNLTDAMTVEDKKDFTDKKLEIIGGVEVNSEKQPNGDVDLTFTLKGDFSKYNMDAIVVYHVNGGKSEKLAVKSVKVVGDTATITATTKSFSPFVLAAPLKETVVETPSTPETPNAPAAGTTTDTATTPKTADTTNILSFALIALLAAFAGVTIYKKIR